jgi:hypothetical protein
VVLSVDSILTPRLGALLALEPDGPFAERLRRVLAAGARAISKLGEIDLVAFEETLPEESSADLSMWEQVAPVVAETLANVNALLLEIDTDFPEGEVAIEDRQDAVLEVIRTFCTTTSAEVAAFGQRVRDPAVVGDQWNLLTELQSFRFRFRNAIGNLVFEVASQLGPCRRPDVEPGYQEALASALMVRSTTADLRRLMHARIAKVAEAAPEDVEWHLKQVERELSAFGRTSAWRALRAQDKRAIIEVRRQLQGLNGTQVSREDILRTLEPFVETCDTFTRISLREMLVEHDREVEASVGVLLERGLTASRPMDRLAALQEALRLGQALYGKSTEFDGFLRRLRKLPASTETVGVELETLGQLLAGLLG